MIRSFREFVTLAAAALCVASCSFAAPPAAVPAAPQPRSTPLKVVATIGMIADTAAVIAGERAKVTGLMGPGVDPHLYKASPGDLRLMTDADLILYNGLHLEGRLADVLVRIAARRATVQVTDTIPEASLRSPPEFDGHFDPHVWFDPMLWRAVAERTRDALTAADPASEREFARATERFIARLTELDRWARASVSTVPEPSRVLVTAHDAFGYLGRAYGLEVLAIQGISTDSEASIRGMNSLVDTLVERRIPAVFVESSVPRKTIESLVEGCKSRGHEVRIGGELFSDALGPAGTPEGTYLGMFEHNVRTIVEALGGEPVELHPAAESLPPPAAEIPSPSAASGRE